VLRLAGRPFILLEVRHVSLRLCMRTLGVDDVARAVAEVLRRHDIVSANWVGHSFGTFVIAHMRKIYPEAVSSVLLCDPVRCLPPCQCRTFTCSAALCVRSLRAQGFLHLESGCESMFSCHTADVL
jgi:pimeloyl-ACP methyl ester carboxylesterase